MSKMLSPPVTGSLLRDPQEETPAHRETSACEAMDLIFIEGFEGASVIGMNPDELDAPQALRIDLVAGMPRNRACETDRIADTIDYGAVHEALGNLLATHRVKLLEALAEAIATLLLERFGAHWVRVVLVKPRKFDNVAAVGVVIERGRKAGPTPPVPVLDDGSVSYLWRAGPAG